MNKLNSQPNQESTDEQEEDIYDAVRKYRDEHPELMPKKTLFESIHEMNQAYADLKLEIKTLLIRKLIWCIKLFRKILKQIHNGNFSKRNN